MLAGLGHGVPALAQTPPAAPSTQAQPAQAPAGLLRVFLDCNRCDEDYMRQNVAFVEYVRDRAVADVHVLVTTQETGGGGLSWTVKFIGLGRLQGQDRDADVQHDSNRDRRRPAQGIRAHLQDSRRHLRVGTPVVAQLDVTFAKPEGGAQATPARDPWNFWVFRIEGNTNMNGEASSKSKQYRGIVLGQPHDREVEAATSTATRTTAATPSRWTTRRRSSSTRNSWNFNALVVKSLGAEVVVRRARVASHSSFSNNTDRQYVVRPGIEYDFFPYPSRAGAC